MNGFGPIDVLPGMPAPAVEPDFAYSTQVYSDVDFLRDFGRDFGQISNSGEKVTPYTALRQPAVWQAITRISADVAKLPLKLYLRDGNNGREEANKHPVQKLLMRPNREMNWFMFWQRVMVQRLLYNYAYVYIERDNAGRPLQLLPLLSDRTTCQRHHTGQCVYLTEVYKKEGSELIELQPKDVIYLEGMNITCYQPEDFIYHAREAIGQALATLKFASKFFRRGGRSGGVLELPAAMTKKSKDNIEEGFRKTYDTPDAAFSTVILRDNAKFHAAQQSMRDSQMVDARHEDVKDVARYFNMMPSRLGEESATSYNSKSDDNRDYLDTTLSPHLVAITAELGFKLLNDREQVKYYFEHKTDRLLMMDPLQHAQRLQILKQAMVITTDEARKTLDLPAIKGGDKLENPNTTAPDSEPTGSDEAPPEVAEEAARVMQHSLREVLCAIEGKALRACNSLRKLNDWHSSKLPGELARMKTSLEPHEALLRKSGSLIWEHIDSSVATVASDVAEGFGKIQAGDSDSLRSQISKHFAWIKEHYCEEPV